jgi:hypothetical protein
MNFRKRPVVVSAVRFTGDNGDEVAAFMQCQHPFVEGGELKIGALEGTMSAKGGDWIIRGVKGEFYPCKPDIFEATYEVVNENAALKAGGGKPPAPNGGSLAIAALRDLVDQCCAVNEYPLSSNIIVSVSRAKDALQRSGVA